MSELPLSDRKIIDTGRFSSGVSVFRTPEVRVVGVEYDAVSTAAPTEPAPPPAETEVDTSLPAPSNFQVESQTVQIQPDGSARVDVVVSFEAPDEYDRYELRLAKV
jgi:hypothetical protein